MFEIRPAAIGVSRATRAVQGIPAVSYVDQMRGGSWLQAPRVGIWCGWVVKTTERDAFAALDVEVVHIRSGRSDTTWWKFERGPNTVWSDEIFDRTGVVRAIPYAGIDGQIGRVTVLNDGEFHTLFTELSIPAAEHPDSVRFWQERNGATLKVFVTLKEYADVGLPQEIKNYGTEGLTSPITVVEIGRAHV